MSDRFSDHVFAVVVLGIFAMVFLIVTIALAAQLRRVSRLRTTVKRTPTSRIASAQPGLVELAGVAVSAGEILTAPLTGAFCLYYSLAVDDGSDKPCVIDETKWCDFYVDDGSGAVARLTGPNLHLASAARVKGNAKHADKIGRLLTARGISKTAEELAQFTWFEERVDVGVPIHVLGEARAMPRRPDGAYRADAARERFIVVAPRGGELVVSVGSEADLAAKLRGETTIGRWVVGLLAVSFVGCVVTIALLLS